MKKLFYLSVVALLFSGATVYAQTPVNPTLNTQNPFITPCEDTTSDDCYTLIEPLPGSDGKDIGSITLTGTGNNQGLGGFINFAMELGIGVAGLLGVIMLVIYGFQYAAEDKNIQTFAQLREKITKVILGLLLLLGITIILKTINPDLLIVEPGIQIQALDIDENGDGVADPTALNANQGSAVGIKPEACPSGIVRVEGIDVCKSIATKFGNMITAARAANIPIGGWGARTPQRQMELRNQNCSCGGNMGCINNKPVKQCVPWTAKPGTSRHESGLAVDFTCNGVTMRSGSSCFVWMKQNASRYGFFNLPSESWHWSIDGR